MTGKVQQFMVKTIRRAGIELMPFADAATEGLPFGRLMRLALFQVAGGMATVLLVGTLNRVMIVELRVSAMLVAILIALPVLSAPFRTFIGFKSDHHKSAIGWRRVPYIWMGSSLMFGGLAIMPFALLLLSGDGDSQYGTLMGHFSAALAFLMVGAGVHVTQTAGLALATDLATKESHPRVVSLMYMMQLVGMVGTGFIFGYFLQDFTPVKLVQVVQGAAVVSAVLHIIALWKQEARNPARTTGESKTEEFSTLWRRFTAETRARRFLVALGLGTAAFAMQDIILEPYGAEVLGLSVSETTTLTAIMALGSILAFATAARTLVRGQDPARLAAWGILIGIAAFTTVIMAAPLQSANIFRLGTFGIGLGAGLFAVSTLTMAMSFDHKTGVGLALGAWGAVQATAAGSAMGLGGIMRDVIATLAAAGKLGPAFNSPAISYAVVYHLEILLLFIALAAIGPLVGQARDEETETSSSFGLTAFPN
jgi:BCD family chlorophyll transporter-like MFS transporter